MAGRAARADDATMGRSDSDGVMIRRVNTEETPLIGARPRAYTDKRRGLPPRRTGSFQLPNKPNRLDLGSSTILDRLVYCYDQTPPKKTGFVLKSSLSCAHLGTPFPGDLDMAPFGVTSPLLAADHEIKLAPACYAKVAAGDLPRVLEVTNNTLLQQRNVSGTYTVRNDVSRYGWPVWELEEDDRDVSDAASDATPSFSHQSIVLTSTADGQWVVRTNTDPPRVLAATAGRHGEAYPNQWTGGWIDGATTMHLSNFAVIVPPTEFLLALGWTALLCGVTAMSSIGPLAAHFRTVHGTLLGCWIAQAMSLIFLATAVGSYFVFPKNMFAKPLSWLFKMHDQDDTSAPGGLPVLLLSGVASGVGSGAWTQSFSMTPIPVAYLLASFGPTVIVLFRMISSSAVHPSRLELLGVAVGVVGGLWTCGGTLLGESSLGVVSLSTMLVGNLLAFTCSITTAVCAMAGKFASCVSTVFYLTGVCLLSALTQGVLACMLIPQFAISADPNFGLFGWLDAQWHPIFFYLVLAFVVGQWGLFFFLQVGTALQQAAVMTAQPVITTFLGVLVFGTQHAFPSMLVTLGGVVTIGGSLLVIVGGQHHQIPSE